MYIRKMTSKGQTTIPKEIREKLHAEPGDTLSYDMQENGTVMMRKVRPIDVAWHDAISGTLEEWNTPEAHEAFRDL
jgi:AbrB family looped-hinge helix DNA binding protein